ncbi:MAG: hypothetical protein JWR19_416 [Pedosphaera sp.]|nr:hypothetical protein [Pedosphaera sp.]
MQIRWIQGKRIKWNWRTLPYAFANAVYFDEKPLLPTYWHPFGGLLLSKACCELWLRQPKLAAA